jgi:hypothetical protein
MQKIITTKDGTTTPSRKSTDGRPKIDAVKDHWISFRVTSAEHFLLIDKANRSGMSAGEYARSRVMRGIARKKKQPKTIEAFGDQFGDQARALLIELRRQGTNLNQIAHHCHRHQFPPPPELTHVIASLQELWRKVMG